MKLNNRNSLAKFTKDNIEEYNKKHNNLNSKQIKNAIKKQLNIVEEPKFSSTDIGVYLTKKFKKIVNDPTKKEKLDKQIDKLAGYKKDVKKGLEDIANKNVISLNELEEYYINRILQDIKKSYLNDKSCKKDIMTRLLDYDSHNEGDCYETQRKYVKNTLEHNMSKALFLALLGGFNKTNVEIDAGTKIANEGDSAQFLFLARAILAGFTCSNVDVRSTRYDAIIDYDGDLLKVQVKGISGTSVSLRDRDRGGEGIDSKSQRNKGKIISSKEVDIYVAVDKQFGICYLIPAKDVDKWVKKGIDNISVSNLIEYRENWDIVSKVAREKFS